MRHGRRPSRQHIALVFLVVVGTPGAFQLALCGAGTAPGEWHAGRPRPPKQGEVPFEDAFPLLQDPQDLNYSPGPGGLLAVVKTDAKHHPRIYLHDSSSATPRLLIDRIANQPKWAPQGERIACTVWKSLTRPWELCIVTLGKADTLYPSFGAHAVQYRWSPDAKYLAVQGTLYGRARSVLAVIETSQGGARIVDSLGILSDYEFGWSPDSRKIAVSRPVRLAQMEQVAEAELWVIGVEGSGAKLASSTGFIYRSRRWIDDTRLLFARERPSSQSSETLVLDVGRAKPGR